MSKRLLSALVSDTRSERRNWRDQDGAEVIQFMGSLMVLLLFTLIVVQLTIVFLNGILVNHALAMASQEAAVRGGVDPQVRSQFMRYLPGGLARQCVNCLQSTGGESAVNIIPGREPTRNGDQIRLSYTYQQPLPLMSYLVPSAGSLAMKRSMLVVSQSLKGTDQ